jgi:hypothetical protein
MEAQSYLLPIYQRCIRLLVAVLMNAPGEIAGGSSSGNKPHSTHYDPHDEMNKDFAVCAMDVISAICEGLNTLFVDLLSSSSVSAPSAPDQTTQQQQHQSVDLLLQLMVLGLKDTDLPELRQSSFSLAGELCKHSFSLFANHSQGLQLINQLMSISTMNLDTLYPLVCNNAAWTIGELSIQVSSEVIYPFLNDIMNGLIFALQTCDLTDNLKVNIAITIGRLAMKCPYEIASFADEFFAAWCNVLSFPHCPYTEKCQAFYGLLAILSNHPELIIGNKSNIYSLLIAAYSWIEHSIEDDSFNGNGNGSVNAGATQYYHQWKLLVVYHMCFILYNNKMLTYGEK